MSNSDSMQQCLGSATALKAETELIEITLCQPIRNICDGTTSEIFFSAGELPEINGIFTVNNSSNNCTILLLVEDIFGIVVYSITPQDAVTIGVNALTNMGCTCIGPDPNAFCTGSFEAALYYCVNC